MGDTEYMFHQILVEHEDCDVLHFLWRDNYLDPIEDYHMNVHLLGKVNSLSIANWTIKKVQWTNLILLTKFLSKP